MGRAGLRRQRGSSLSHLRKVHVIFCTWSPGDTSVLMHVIFGADNALYFPRRSGTGRLAFPIL